MPQISPEDCQQGHYLRSGRDCYKILGFTDKGTVRITKCHPDDEDNEFHDDLDGYDEVMTPHQFGQFKRFDKKGTGFSKKGRKLKYPRSRRLKDEAEDFLKGNLDATEFLEQQAPSTSEIQSILGNMDVDVLGVKNRGGTLVVSVLGQSGMAASVMNRLDRAIGDSWSIKVINQNTNRSLSNESDQKNEEPNTDTAECPECGTEFPIQTEYCPSCESEVDMDKVEEANSEDIAQLKNFLKDPLWQDFLLADSESEARDALQTLRSIRTQSSIDEFKKLTQRLGIDMDRQSLLNFIRKHNIDVPVAQKTEQEVDSAPDRYSDPMEELRSNQQGLRDIFSFMDDRGLTEATVDPNDGVTTQPKIDQGALDMFIRELEKAIGPSGPGATNLFSMYDQVQSVKFKYPGRDAEREIWLIMNDGSIFTKPAFK